MLKNTNTFIEFSVDYTGELEDLEVYDNDHTEEQIQSLIDRAKEENLLNVGERATGTIEIQDGNIVFNYQYCSELGEDYGDDVWEDDEFTIPNM